MEVHYDSARMVEAEAGIPPQVHLEEEEEGKRNRPRLNVKVDCRGMKVPCLPLLPPLHPVPPRHLVSHKIELHPLLILSPMEAAPQAQEARAEHLITQACFVVIRTRMIAWLRVIVLREGTMALLGSLPPTPSSLPAGGWTPCQAAQVPVWAVSAAEAWEAEEEV